MEPSKECDQSSFEKSNDDSYITPYQTTVFYLENDVIGKGVCHLAPQVQECPLVSLEHIDWNNLHNLPYYITPEVVFLNIKVPNDNISNDIYDKFFQRGFQVIHIFTPTMVHCTQLPEEPNPHIVSFSYTDFYEHVSFRSMCDVYIMDLILKSTDHNYISQSDTTHEQALCFMSALSTYGWGVIPNSQQSFHVLDMVLSLIEKGKGIMAERERLVNLKLNRGIVFGKYFTIHGTDLATELRNLALVYPKFVESKATTILCYDVHIQGVRIYGLSLTESLLDTFATYNPKGTFGDVIVDVPWSDVHLYLPFTHVD